MNAFERNVPRSLSALFACLAVSIVPTAQAQDAVAPGAEFLRLVDAKQYAESWGVASDLFKGSVSQKDWVAQIRQVREPMGDVVTRALKSSEPQKNPPGAPSGDYLLQTYETKFARSEPARTETLPLIKTDDGQWRAVGYFVR